MALGVFGTQRIGFRIVESPHDKATGIPSPAQADAYAAKDRSADPLLDITPPLNPSGIFRGSPDPQPVSPQWMGDLAEQCAKDGSLSRVLEALRQFERGSEERKKIHEIAVQAVESIAVEESQKSGNLWKSSFDILIGIEIDTLLRIPDTACLSDERLLKLVSLLDAVKFFDRYTFPNPFKLADLYPRIPISDEKNRKLVQRLYTPSAKILLMDLQNKWRNGDLSFEKYKKIQERLTELLYTHLEHPRPGAAPDPRASLPQKPNEPEDPYFKAEKFAKSGNLRGVIEILGRYEGNEETRKKICELAIQLVESSSFSAPIDRDGRGYNFYGLAELYPFLSGEKSELVKGLFIESLNYMLDDISRGIDRRRDLPSDERRKAILQNPALAQPMLKKARKLIKLV